MPWKTDLKQKWAVTSYELQDTYTDFILSKQAMLCSPKTVRFYHFTAGRFVKYLEENYISAIPQFDMPTIAKKRLPVLSASQVKKALEACTSLRDKAIIMLLVDTGLRRAEICGLCWGDVDLSSGMIRVARGKGGKARSVVAGIKTRRALLAYRREIQHGEAFLFSKPVRVIGYPLMASGRLYFVLANEQACISHPMLYEGPLRHCL